MKIAKVARLQGEIIEASEAEYHNYYGMTLCLCCDEPVFLRKAHVSRGVKISAAFVHHEGEKEQCKLRTSSISLSEIVSINNKSRNQRLFLLNQNCWRMLQSSICYITPQLHLSEFTNKDKKFYLKTRSILTKSFTDSRFRSEFKTYLTQVLKDNMVVGKHLKGSGGTVVSYELVKNSQIAQEVLAFCLSAKGKNILLKMIPTICFLTRQIFNDKLQLEAIVKQQLTKFGKVDLAITTQVVAMNVILNWFLRVNWVDEFDKIS